MRYLKISILILFLFCLMGGDYGYGLYGAIETMTILRSFSNGNNTANLTLFILLSLQIIGIISIIKSYNFIMALVTIGLIMIMILGTIMSTSKIGLEIIPNCLFLIAAITYLVLYLRNINRIGVTKRYEVER